MWQPGHWHWNGHDYEWLDGHYVEKVAGATRWEPGIVQLIQQIIREHGGNITNVPEWRGSDFDGIYVVRLTRTNDVVSATFERTLENLDGQPTACPG